MNDSVDIASVNPEGTWRRSHFVWLAVPIALFVVLRLPHVVHAPGFQDEHWFSVPGWTVWNEGIPRIPYVPTRERSTFFENADRCLMALPPALFYTQAPFHAVFSPGYPTSRIPLFLGALGSIGFLFGFARWLGASLAASLLVTTLLAISRPLMFTGLMTRPDLLASLCGWLCLWWLMKYAHSGQDRQVFISGAFCGLGGLYHPMAMIFVLQVGAAVLLFGAGWRDRLLTLVKFSSTCGAVLALWLPLIAMYPYEFRSQFFANVLDRAGPGLPSRLLWPWASLRHHAWLLWEFVGPWQIALFSVASVAAVAVAFFKPIRIGQWRFIALIVSSVYFVAVVAGVHPSKGYWVYPTVWILAGLALALDHWMLAVIPKECPFWSNRIGVTKRRGLSFLCVALAALALMLPGSGLRSTAVYWRHWGDSRFHAPRFIAGVLDRLPKRGLYLADLSYVYDVYLSGREVVLCQERQQYWGDEEIDYVALLLTWEGEDAGWAEQYDGVFRHRFGARKLPQMCFVDLYVPESAAQNGDADATAAEKVVR